LLSGLHAVGHDSMALIQIGEAFAFLTEERLAVKLCRASYKCR